MSERTLHQPDADAGAELVWQAEAPPAGLFGAPEDELGSDRSPRRRLRRRRTVTGPRPARSRTGGLWPRSLRSRLVVGVAALVVLLVGAIGTVTFISLRSFVLDKLDKQLAPVADNNQHSIARCLAYSACYLGPPGAYSAPTTEWIIVLDEQGRSVLPVDSSKSLRFMSLSTSERTAVLKDPGASRTLFLTDGTELRATARVVEVPGGAQYVVVTGLSTADVHDTLHRVLLSELIIGLAAAVLAVGLTTLGVRRSLRNLYAVTGTAQEVAAELSPEGAGLDRRVPVTEEGTEVGQLAESMNTLLAAVETQFAARLESEQRMRQFLADASHELRTPLTSIRGYAELARMRGSGDAGDDLGRIEAEGTRMSRLVEDLLTLARTDQADAPPLQHLIEVDDLVGDVVASSRAAFPGRTITAQMQPGLAIVGDPDQLVRVVRNLVANAAVHTDAAGPITVRASHDGSDAVIQVIDAGPGLPPDQAAHVFERFWRADRSRARARGGSGLGLSIVSSLVQANGGNVRFDSSVETGTTVTVRLPAATP